MSNYILEMTDITKEFPGVKALDKVQLKVRPGTVHALMGENGAGKSTLMKCLIGIYHKSSGKIIYDGKEVDFNTTFESLNAGVFCKYFLDKVAKHFWTLLHVQIGQSCKALASRVRTSHLMLCRHF